MCSSDLHFQQPWHFSLLMGKELLRLFIISTLTALGKSDWFVSRRYRPLTSAQKLHAEDGLAIVRNQVLPLVASKSVASAPGSGNLPQ